MYVLFGLLFLVSPILLIIGLIRPKSFLKILGNNVTRKKLTLIFTSLMVISVFGIGLTNPSKPNSDSLKNINKVQNSTQKPQSSTLETAYASSKPSVEEDSTSDDEGDSIHDNSPAQQAKVTSVSGCDQSLWDHVYHPSRLKIIDNCKSVSGVIDDIRKEADGDDHILLKLYSQYAQLINSKNTQYEHGDLVLEPVCEQTATQADAISYCQNYRSNVQIPPIGTHVTVVGSYVLDTDHGWNEIHPVTSIQAYTATKQTTSVSQQATTSPTSTPIPAPKSSLSIAFNSVSSPVNPGDIASVTITTSPSASCNITVTYNSGPSQASGLNTQTANGSGSVTWSWKVGTRTAAGTYPIAINCNLNGLTSNNTTNFTVN